MWHGKEMHVAFGKNSHVAVPSLIFECQGDSTELCLESIGTHFYKTLHSSSIFEKKKIRVWCSLQLLIKTALVSLESFRTKAWVAGMKGVSYQ